MLTDLSCRKSCRRWPLFSKIQWLSSSCSGPKPWLHITFPTIWCHMMFLPDGIQPSTCSTLQLNTIQQSTPWLQLGNSTFANTSWYHQIGWLQENCEMFYRYFCFIPLIFTCASFFARFSKTPHSFSHKALQTLQWWSPQWITSIRSLLLHLTVLTSSPLLSVLLLWLVRRLWTDTIRRPITQMSTGSPWVRLSFFTVVICYDSFFLALLHADTSDCLLSPLPPSSHRASVLLRSNLADAILSCCLLSCTILIWCCDTISRVRYISTSHLYDY